MATSRRQSGKSNPLLFLAILTIGVAFLYYTFHAGDAITNYGKTTGKGRGRRPPTQENNEDRPSAHNEPASTPNNDGESEDIAVRDTDPAAILFAEVDVNGDGIVSHHEFWTSDQAHGPDPASLWTSTDLNVDGELTLDELRVSMSAMPQQQQQQLHNQRNGGTDQGVNLFADLDANRDGRLSKREFKELNGGVMTKKLEGLWNGGTDTSLIYFVATPC